MNIIYSDQKINDLTPTTYSVFLAGPTPRDALTPSWRPRALKLLSSYTESDGITVFYPELSATDYNLNYDTQVEWERKGLTYASVILFWIPRKLDTLPGFTTNVEFGYYIATKPHKVLYGRPVKSEKNRYLDWLYEKETRRKPLTSLTELIGSAVKYIKHLQSWT